ncbi:MAG: hypothetical protein RL291_1428 [Pseudomonadota bacterium]
MRCNPLRWLWGLIPVVMLSWLAVQGEHQRIERDLAERVQASLAAQGQRWAGASFSGRDGIVSGRANDEADLPRAESLARNVYGVRVIENRSSLIEKADRYVWGATKRDRTVTLTGFAPNENTKASIVRTAGERFPGYTIVDQMRLARGLSQQDTWLTGLNFGMSQLARLERGEAKMDNLALTVEGDAADFGNYRTVRQALGSQMPAGVRLASENVRPPAVRPFTWGARHGNNQVLLQGHVPSEAAKADLFRQAQQAFPRVTVVDRTEVARGAPQGFVAAAQRNIADLARLLSGAADISDTTSQLSGEAANEGTARSVMTGYQSGLGQGFRGTATVRYPEPPPPPPPPPPVVVAPPPPPPPPAPKAISPYITSVASLGSRMILSGYVPSPEARQRLVASTERAFPGRQIEDRLEVGPGAPDGWGACADGHLAGLSRLENGRFVMRDRRAELTGGTYDEALVTSLPASVRSATQNDCESTARIELLPDPEPNLVWRATRQGNDVVLEGDVPNAQTRSALMDSARRRFPNATVTDRMRIVEYRGRRWGQTADDGLAMLADLRSGEVALDRRNMTLRGEAPSNEAKGRAVGLLGRERERGYSVREAVTVRTDREIAAEACQATLQRVAREGIIQFERASAALAQSSNATLDRIVAAARQCPGLAVDIEGHTDNEGTEERNKALSERRARSVVDYLVRAGIPANQLKAVGYGAGRPIAPNDTAEGRARNRRIEFTVRSN